MAESYHSESVAVDCSTPEPPPAPDKPTKVSPIDLLRAEKLQLEMRNIQLQLEIMQRQLADALKARGETVARMNKLRDEYIVTYGVDIARMQINEDGTFTPVEGPMMNMKGLG